MVMKMTSILLTVVQHIPYWEQSKLHFSHLVLRDAYVNTIWGSAKLIESSGKALITLPSGMKININEALYSLKSERNLLSFKDIRWNGYHVETMCEENIEYLSITKISSGQVCVENITRVALWIILCKAEQEWIIYGGRSKVHHP